MYIFKTKLINDEYVGWSLATTTRNSLAEIMKSNCEQYFLL